MHMDESGIHSYYRVVEVETSTRLSFLTKCVHTRYSFQRDMGTIVLECCASGRKCDGARGLCRHLYDSAPAGEFGTSHYIIKAMIMMFT